MKLLVVLSLVALAVAAPPPPPPTLKNAYNDVQVLRYENDNQGLGNYKYGYEQSDGSKVEQQGELRNEGREDQYIYVKGYYSWISPDGVKYLISYVADDNGFQPEIEEGPGVSPALAASLIG